MHQKTKLVKVVMHGPGILLYLHLFNVQTVWYMSANLDVTYFFERSVVQ